MSPSAKTNIALTIPEPGKFELVARPYPVIKSGYAIIKTEIAPICLEGSRIWAEHDFEFHDDPQHLGHEGVGTVEDVLPGSNFAVGDRVIVFQGDHCGHCHACTQALSPTYCDANDPDIRGNDGSAMRGIQNRNESPSGGFAMERYRIAPEANLIRIPDALEFRYAASANCSFGVGFSNQEAMDVKAGDTVLVGGVGFIALGHIIAALYRNATVIALARNPYRIDLMRRMGVEHVINPDDPDWLEQVRALSYKGQGVDVAIDGSGVTYYQEKLMKAVRKYGQINFSGHTPGAHLELSPLHHVIDPAHTIFGQHDVRAKDRERLVRALCDPKVQAMVDVMVTHEFPMSRAGEAFDVQVGKQCGKVYLWTQQ
ncbi:oxidoreductase, zinc-binding dehydrogenase family [gamma proteobacterium NOR5-3]|nr:oxidoreductase, zinc-binding dehydrogenase family [gamma proteobacterium NOR5-3]